LLKTEQLRIFLSHGRDKPNISSFLFLSELKLYHLSFFNIITHGAFDIADPSSDDDDDDDDKLYARRVSQRTQQI